ncbi:MAG: hypothetical protein ACYCYP_13830 [Leptospirales bacterium]
MTCPKCKGWMVREEFRDIYEDFIKYDGWRCLLCGQIVDTVILHNRANPQKPVMGRNRRLKLLEKNIANTKRR